MGMKYWHTLQKPFRQAIQPYADPYGLDCIAYMTSKYELCSPQFMRGLFRLIAEHYVNEDILPVITGFAHNEAVVQQV